MMSHGGYGTCRVVSHVRKEVKRVRIVTPMGSCCCIAAGMYDLLYSGYPLVVSAYGVSFGSSESRLFFMNGCSSGYQSRILVVRLHGPLVAGVLGGAVLPELPSRRFSFLRLLRIALPSTVG